MTPLEYMQKELTIMAGEFEQHLTDCALEIATEYDKEGHSGHTIGWFSNRFKQICLGAFKNGVVWLPTTWAEYAAEQDIRLGAGELEEQARKEFDNRIAVLDKFSIRRKVDVETVLKLVTLYTKMKPLRQIDLADDSKYEDKHNHGYLYHVDDPHYYKRDGQLHRSDLGVMSDNGGSAWFTNRKSNPAITPDFDQTTRTYYILVDENQEVAKPIRTAKPGSIVRNMFGDAFKIEGIAPHADTTQPYFTLHQIVNGEPDLAASILVSSAALISTMVEIKELGFTVPLYQQYPADLEKA